MTASTVTAETLNLAGNWGVRLDRAKEGEARRWFAEPITDPIRLPGAVTDGPYGDPVAFDTAWTGSVFDRSYFTEAAYEPYRQPGNIKVPFWLQPNRRFVGHAWYQRTIDIPESWVGRQAELYLERTHWKTTLWVDDQRVGQDFSLSTPHRYRFAVTRGGKHRLSIRVDNTLNPDIGENSHSVSDHTQSNWNGIIGELSLRRVDNDSIQSLTLYPDATTRSVKISGRVATETHGASISLAVDSQAIPVTPDAEGRFESTLALGATAGLWDEFSPTLHVLRVKAGTEEQQLSFGLRDIHAEGRQLLINGRKTFLRGTLDCASFPRTGYPPTDFATWQRLLGKIKSYGLNHVRFHSWCPPKAAFDAADTLGLYLQVEIASWPNWSTLLGEGKPVDNWIDAETERILQEYGNHPSFVLCCAGNEPGGDKHVDFLKKWVTRTKKADPRRLYTAGAGWPLIPENDYHVDPAPRIQQWGAGLKSRINDLPPETVTDYRSYIAGFTAPLVSHEIGQWCVFPNFDEMRKYTGTLRPRNFEIFQATMRAHGLYGQWRSFLQASGHLQVLCYKEDIESALRTPGMGGFHLLSLGDFPGQGTALVGMLDAFWDEKGYLTADEFRRFTSATVPLARLQKRVFTQADTLEAAIDVAHYGVAALERQEVLWEIIDAHGDSVASGHRTLSRLELGLNEKVETIALALKTLKAPAQYRLQVSLPGTAAQNDWDLWVYPNSDTAPAGVPRIVRALDEGARAALDAGDTLLWVVPSEKVAPPATGRPVALGFSSIFWNTAWTNGQAPHTLGILCDPTHPALRDFPTDEHSNWQWWYPIKHAAALPLDKLPAEVSPVIQVIDDWFTSRKLGLAFEAKVGKGRILVTSIDLTGAELDPVRKQLLYSLEHYMASPAFQPQVELTVPQLATLVLP